MPLPPANQAQVYRALLHQNSMTYAGSDTYIRQTDPHANWAQVYRALLHQNSTVWPIEEATHTVGRWTPTNQTYSYRAQLHHICFTMHIYPGQTGKLTYSNITDRYIEPSTKHFSEQPPHIFFHQLHENAIRTSPHPDQFTHILPSPV